MTTSEPLGDAREYYKLAFRINALTPSSEGVLNPDFEYDHRGNIRLTHSYVSSPLYRKYRVWPWSSPAKHLAISSGQMLFTCPYVSIIVDIYTKPYRDHAYPNLSLIIEICQFSIWSNNIVVERLHGLLCEMFELGAIIEIAETLYDIATLYLKYMRTCPALRGCCCAIRQLFRALRFIMKRTQFAPKGLVPNLKYFAICAMQSRYESRCHMLGRIGSDYPGVYSYQKKQQIATECFGPAWQSRLQCRDNADLGFAQIPNFKYPKQLGYHGPFQTPSEVETRTFPRQIEIIKKQYNSTNADEDNYIEFNTLAQYTQGRVCQLVHSDAIYLSVMDTLEILRYP